ncbi:class I SAM-dependent methyltransferase [Candidatus Zixiibacteriota bacterium]
MTIADLIHRSTPPKPWEEGDNIPWNDPQFSRRMLQEHLSQEHDAASRRSTKIDQHIDWIHRHLLSEQPTRILDLCCGPGLYTSRFSRLGHDCFGVDYSPASIAHARRLSKAENLSCTYLEEDIRKAEYGSSFGLAMMIFGEFNIFRPADASRILKKILAALDKNGLLLLEVHTFTAVKHRGEEKSTWCSVKKGLFSDSPYLFLEESFWEPDGKTSTVRYHIIDAACGAVSSYALSVQAYTESEYLSLLHSCGLVDIELTPSLRGTKDKSQSDFIAFTARKEASR